ncbi:DUF2254 domain-containing protein [Vulgatibacter incomptus]|uniref:DUF2254 domain-containing protein n=1 Tax=Vulgatibacter incomptus TaxID=1391653 RepID=A0A0K1PIB7_9BACT|nr:DUF2254 domain-containing protein [Vulgatibacter incomptus]AKU93265.1 hypothetical protein AKJ08_3652 [Vulgatibacter incomptus]
MRLRPRLRVLRNRSRESPWTLSILGSLIGLVLGFLLGAETGAHIPHILIGVALGTTLEQARTIFIAILAVEITALSIVFSLSLLAVQSAAAQYSPRLISSYLRDPAGRTVLPTFVTTCVFCVVASARIGLSDELGVAPRPALTLAIVLIFASGAALLVELARTILVIRIESVAIWVTRRTRKTIRAMAHLRGERSGTPVPVSATATPLRAQGSGYVMGVDDEILLSSAKKHGLRVWIERAIGEGIVEGSVVGWAEPIGPGAAVSEERAAALADAVLLDRWRDQDTDVSLGLRQLVDVAVRALSAAVNDPYSAIVAIDHLSELLVDLAGRKLGDRVLRDDDGRPRVVIREPSFGDYLFLATDEISRYGAAEPTVAVRLLRMAEEAGEAASSDADKQSAAAITERILYLSEAATTGGSGLERVRAATMEARRKILEKTTPGPRSKLCL